MTKPTTRQFKLIATAHLIAESKDQVWSLYRLDGTIKLSCGPSLFTIPDEQQRQSDAELWDYFTDLTDGLATVFAEDEGPVKNIVQKWN